MNLLYGIFNGNLPSINVNNKRIIDIHYPVFQYPNKKVYIRESYERLYNYLDIIININYMMKVIKDLNSKLSDNKEWSEKLEFFYTKVKCCKRISIIETLINENYELMSILNKEEEKITKYYDLDEFKTLMKEYIVEIHKEKEKISEGIESIKMEKDKYIEQLKKIEDYY